MSDDSNTLSVEVPVRLVTLSDFDHLIRGMLRMNHGIMRAAWLDENPGHVHIAFQIRFRMLFKTDSIVRTATLIARSLQGRVAAGIRVTCFVTVLPLWFPWHPGFLCSGAVIDGGGAG